MVSDSRRYVRHHKKLPSRRKSHSNPLEDVKGDKYWPAVLALSPDKHL